MSLIYLLKESKQNAIYMLEPRDQKEQYFRKIKRMSEDNTDLCKQEESQAVIFTSAKRKFEPKHYMKPNKGKKKGWGEVLIMLKIIINNSSYWDFPAVQ